MVIITFYIWCLWMDFYRMEAEIWQKDCFFTDYLRKNEKKLIFLLDKFTRDCYIRWQVITCNIKTRE